MAGYLIANIEVTDPAKFEEYCQKVVPMVEKFSGRYLVRGGRRAPSRTANSSAPQLRNVRTRPEFGTALKRGAHAGCSFRISPRAPTSDHCRPANFHRPPF
jgi:hypothetical protein